MQKKIFLRGGLGNQFFQWAYALKLKSQGHTVTLDESFLRRKPGNQAQGKNELLYIFNDLDCKVTSEYSHYAKIEPIFTRLMSFFGKLEIEDFSYPNNSKARLLYGYYQSPSYFTTEVIDIITTKLRTEFTSPSCSGFPDDLKAKKYSAVHVRGGDYSQGGYNFDQIGLLSSDYYHRAIESMLTTNDGPTVIVSDDVERAKFIFNVPRFKNMKFIFLDEISNQSKDPLLALKVLINASKLVCANSSFSAMAGYLSNSSQIIAPSPWFRGFKVKQINPSMKNWQVCQSSFEKKPTKNIR